MCEVICKKLGLEILNLFGKLVDCLFNNVEMNEFFIVEGDFVGGFVKLGCNCEF